MHPRTTAMLALVAAVLGAFVYFFQVRGGERRKEAEAEAKRLFPGLAESDVQAIELSTSDGQAARLERREGAWQLVKPIAFPADEAAVSGLASNLAELASEATVEDPQALEVYGLGPGARELRFEAKGTTHRVRLGGQTPLDYNSYATADEGGKIYTVAGYRASSFEKPLDELRERRVLRFDRDAVDRVEVAWPGERVVVEKREGSWRLVSPLDAPADTRTLDDVLATLSFLRAEGFVDAPRAAEEASLAKPALDVRLRTSAAEGAEPREHRLVIGAPVAEGIRLARGAEATLYRVASERVDEVPRRVGAWRHRTLADFTASDARRLELVFHPKGESPVTIAVERTEKGWTGTPEPISAGKAATLVADLSRLRAEDVEAESMGAKELAAVGLSPPRAVLRAFGAPPEGGGEAPRLAEVWLGELDTKRGIHAKVPDADPVYRLDYGLAESLPVSLEAYRNRFVSVEGEEEALPPPEPERPGGLDVPVLEE